MFIDTHIKYRPKSINEFVFPDDQLRVLVNGYIQRNITRPLILYGTHGTGKSLLAELIPKAIDGEGVKVNQVSFDDMSSSKEVSQYFERPLAFDRLFCENEHLNYHVIEELNFKERTYSALRLMLEKFEATNLVIMTTNRLDRIDMGLRSRCHCAEVVPLKPEQFIDRAMKILKSERASADRNTVLRALRLRYEREHDNRGFYKLLDQILLEAMEGAA